MSNDKISFSLTILHTNKTISDKVIISDKFRQY